MYRPSSANPDDGCTKQPNNECPMEDVGERRHRDPVEVSGLLSVGSGGSGVPIRPDQTRVVWSL